MRGKQQLHDFRFVVEGVDLTPEQRDDIEQAVRAAGLRALAAHAVAPNLVVIEPSSLGRNIDWRGYILRALAKAQVKEQAEQIGYR